MAIIRANTKKVQPNPRDVIYPSQRLALCGVIYAEENMASYAIGWFDKKPCLLTRWNGGKNPDGSINLNGFPLSKYEDNPIFYPLWHVIERNEYLTDAVLNRVGYDEREKEKIKAFLNLEDQEAVKAFDKRSEQCPCPFGSCDDRRCELFGI